MMQEENPIEEEELQQQPEVVEAMIIDDPPVEEPIIAEVVQQEPEEEQKQEEPIVVAPDLPMEETPVTVVAQNIFDDLPIKSASMPAASSHLDELPVGGGQKEKEIAMFAQEQPDEMGAPAASPSVDHSGPIEQRLVSKNWVIRAKAFEDITEIFKGALSPNDECFKAHFGNWKKYLADTNPGALEKCLDALNAFIDKGDQKIIASSQNEIIKVLLDKCLSQVKPVIKSKSLECFLMLFEVSEVFEEATEPICECLTMKNPKINQTTISTITAWIAAYGVKKVPLKSLLTFMENFAASTAPAIKTETLNFYRECYRWMGDGPAISMITKNLKKQQQDDLEKDFKGIQDNLEDNKRVPRLTRSEQKKYKGKSAEEVALKKREESKGDDLDLFEPVDILAKYDAAWQDKMGEIKKWEEKKRELDTLAEDCISKPKIKPGDFLGIVKVIKKLMTDSMIAVSISAIKACGNLAKGLGQNFSDQCLKEIMTTVILRFKEKKTQVIDESQIVLDNFLTCSSLENLKDDLITTGLNEKAPVVKKNICQFIERAAQKTYIDVLQRVSGEYLTAFMKLSEDPDSDVRNAALTCLGVFKGRLGEAAMSSMLKDMNKQKLEKVNDSAKNVQPCQYDKPEKQIEKKVAPPALGAAKGTGPPAKKALPKAAAKKEEDVSMQIDDMPIGGGQNQFDDMPIGGGNKGNQFDEMPIGGSNKMPGNELDELPIGGIKKGYNLDDLGEDAFGGPPPGDNFGGISKPKRPPPARLAAKAPVKVDEDMMDDTGMVEVKKAPVRAPPKLSSKEETKGPPVKAAPTKAAPTSAGGPKGPSIQEEDVGAGLSKEEAEAKVVDNFPADVVSNFEDSKKWNEKVEGYKGLAQCIISQQPSADVIEGVVKFVKLKMKDWKESNLNLIKESINLFLAIAQNSQNINKRAVFCMMPFLSDKLGDVKVVNQVSELLPSLSEVVTPKCVALLIIKYASTAKSPKVIQESCNVLLRMTDDFGGITMPLKEMIDYAITAVNHSNPQVRISAMALFAIMYKHAGEMIKNFLKDIKESTMKLIDEELAKVTPFKKGEFQRKRNFKGQAAEDESAAGKGGKKGAEAAGGLDDLFPRADISKLLNPKLMPLFKDNDWKKRKEAGDKVEEILKGANMRIQPVGLGELMDNIKQRMTDPNKAVLKAFVQLICVVVEALGANAKQFSKKILPPMLLNLADKQSLVRADVVTAMEKWAEHCGAELIISIGGPMITQDNPELRTEMLGWIIKNKESIKLMAPENLKELVKPLVECLSDKTPAIRNSTEEVICTVMPLTGYPAFQAIITNLKPAVQQTIKPVLEKVKNKCGAGAAPLQANSAPTNAAPVQDQMNSSITGKGSFAQAAAVKAGPTLKASVQQEIIQAKPVIKAKEPINQEAKMNSSIGLNNSAIQKREGTFNQTPSGNKKLMESISKPSAPASSGPKLKNPMAASVTNFKADASLQESFQSEGLTVNFGHKEKRSEIDKKTKFPIEDIKNEHIEKLKGYSQQALGPVFAQKMFSQDFKLHCECIDAFASLISNQPDSILEILDLIFKWSLVRLSDSSNTKFAVNIFDFFASLFTHLQEQQYCLWEFEAAIIIPLLCEKTNLNNNILKDKVKKLLRMSFDVYERQKCYNLVVNHGLNSKNLVTQAECLDELAEFIHKFGIDYSSEKEMKYVAKLADNGSKAIRENALKMLGEAFMHLEDNIWRVIGDVTPKVQGLLEQRFKKLKGTPTMMPSASMASFKAPNAEMNQQMSSSIGFKSQGAGSAQQKKTIQPVSTTARTPLAFNRQDAPTFNQAQNNSMQKSLTNMTQGSPAQTSKFQANSNNQSIGGISKLKPLAQTSRPQTSIAQASPVQQQQFPQYQQQITFAPQNQMMMPSSQNTLLFSHNDEDDEDLRIFTNDGAGESIFGDPRLDRMYDDITRLIHQLKYADLSKRVDSLVSLNEMIGNITEQTQPVLARASNELIGAFVQVMMEVFDRSAEEINLRFAKYFISIVLKTCSCREIMQQVNEDKVLDLTEQLLTKLLIENLDKVGENKEGDSISKNLNASMLRILENCNHTYIICALIDLQRKYKDYPSLPKLPNLVVKCLLKISKIIERLIDRLNIEKIFLSMHEYLLEVNHENRNQNDDLGIKMVKTFINEIVKIKRDDIWTYYPVIRCHQRADLHIHKWIDIILKSIRVNNTNGGSSSAVMSSTGTANNLSTLFQSTLDINSNSIDIKQIVEDLKNPEKFENALQQLAKILQDNPEMNLDQYLHNCSPTFQRFIKGNLDTLRASATQTKDIEPRANTRFNNGMTDSLKSTSHSDGTPMAGSGSYQYQQQTVQQQPEAPVRSSQGFATFSQRQTIPTAPQTSNLAQNDRLAEQQSKLEKLQSMKQRMSIMKSGDNSAVNRGEHTAPAGGGNMNTSFSAMNSSLSQKWMSKKSQISSSKDVMGGLAAPQMSSTMGPGFAGAMQQQTTSQQMNQSHGGGEANLNFDNNVPSAADQQQTSQPVAAGGGTAQNQDLNKRLAEMKARLQALKQQKQ